MIFHGFLIAKNNYRDHPHTEVINRETLEILKLIPNNQDIFKVHFLSRTLDLQK